jgi:hypothetical protein
MKRFFMSVCSILFFFFSPPLFAQKLLPPKHVVIVIEENHALEQIIGNLKEAPYINALAKIGAVFTNSHGVMHPSQPNYLALFSGSTQGVEDDTCPAPGSPFSSPNLASELLAKGYTFAGYSDDLPYPGYSGCFWGAYARKHVPWTNWLSLKKFNLPFSQFPKDFSKLPTVSFVIPNLNHDMHGTKEHKKNSWLISHGDAWLKKNLSPYISWAMKHDSLFILTFDEDNDTPANHIPTLFVGPMIKPGRYSFPINHYNVLRTLEALYSLGHAGKAKAGPIKGIWK